MTPERWRQIEDLYHAALECAPLAREGVLAGVDPELRREVESLLARDGSMLDQPAWELRDPKPGAKVGVYEILGKLGQGGMGTVYRALDSRLNRQVAIKVMAEPFRGRFQHEAQTIARLNHPKVCTLYDVGPDYLVMELVEGPTLAERIAKGPLPLEEALGIACQISEALEAAHEKGIVHRDLKPANVKLRADGSVKVLDFGLAQGES
jgi:serine/threonine protein kinase